MVRVRDEFDPCHLYQLARPRRSAPAPPACAVDVALTGLTTGTTYYFRVAGTNSSGTTRGSILSFTPGSAPTVANLAATPVGATTATLNGNVNPNGLATEAWFVWGTSSTLAGGTSTTHEAIGAGTSAVAVDVALTGLTTGTTYYYRVVASNSSGQTNGTPILNFTSGAAPAATTVAASVRRRYHGDAERQRHSQRPGDGCLVRVGDGIGPRRRHQHDA